MWLLISISLFSSLLRFTSCTDGIFSGYYIVNKGFYPSKMDGDVISYNAFLTKGKPSEKRICGIWIIHRRIKPLGMAITMEKRTEGAGSIANMGQKIIIENLCETKFPIDDFINKFNGTIGPDCSLEAGVYSLCNWTFEDHMKKVTPKALLGLYIYHLCWTEDSKNCVLKNDLIMDVRDIKEKEAEDKMAAGGVKQAKKEKKDKKEEDKKDKKDKKGKKGQLPEQSLPGKPDVPDMKGMGGKW